MKVCPKCGAPSVDNGDGHAECPSCGFYFNHIALDAFLRRHEVRDSARQQQYVPEIREGECPHVYRHGC